MSATDSRPVELAREALIMAMRDGITPDVATLVEQIYTETGPEGAYVALMVWCDTVLIRYGIAGPIAIKFQDYDTGKITDAEGVTRSEAVWGGQMMSARAAMDQVQWEALIQAVPTGKAMGAHVLALLETAALMLRQSRTGGA